MQDQDQQTPVAEQGKVWTAPVLTEGSIADDTQSGSSIGAPDGLGGYGS